MLKYAVSKEKCKESVKDQKARKLFITGFPSKISKSKFDFLIFS